jgi:hypothetical protein
MMLPLLLPQLLLLLLPLCAQRITQAKEQAEYKQQQEDSIIEGIYPGFRYIQALSRSQIGAATCCHVSYYSTELSVIVLINAAAMWHYWLLFL